MLRLLSAIGPLELGGSTYLWRENCSIFGSHVALTQLFMTERPSLDHITVKGDLIITAATSNGEYAQLILVNYSQFCPPVIVTRSRAKQSTKTAIC